MESEEDDAAPVPTVSNPVSSSNEISLRLRGRMVEVVLLEEGKRLSLLFIVAAAAGKLESEILASGSLNAHIPTCQSIGSMAGQGKRWQGRAVFVRTSKGKGADDDVGTFGRPGA